MSCFPPILRSASEGSAAGIRDEHHYHPRYCRVTHVATLSTYLRPAGPGEGGGESVGEGSEWDRPELQAHSMKQVYQQ